MWSHPAHRLEVHAESVNVLVDCEWDRSATCPDRRDCMDCSRRKGKFAAREAAETRCIGPCAGRGQQGQSSGDSTVAFQMPGATGVNSRVAAAAGGAWSGWPRARLHRSSRDSSTLKCSSFERACSTSDSRRERMRQNDLPSRTALRVQKSDSFDKNVISATDRGRR